MITVVHTRIFAFWTAFMLGCKLLLRGAVERRAVKFRAVDASVSTNTHCAFVSFEDIAVDSQFSVVNAVYLRLD